MSILITGGCGYIGSHVVWALKDLNRDVVILDDLSTGTPSNTPSSAKVVVGDIGDQRLLESMFRDHSISAVMHFAGKILPSESLERPLLYFQENVSKFTALLEESIRAGVPNFILSSTAAVYGQSNNPTVCEESPIRPMTPYGHSKLMAETILSAACAAYGVRGTALRYFNVAGADAAGRCGARGDNPGHLIRTAIEVAVGRRPILQVFGNDYPTKDGTAVRDYIHVSDLASAHVCVLDQLPMQTGFRVLNCGYGNGASVLDVIEAVQQVTGESLPFEIVGRRAGDPPALIADASALKALGTWHPRHNSLHAIIQSAFQFQQTTKQ